MHDYLFLCVECEFMILKFQWASVLRKHGLGDNKSYKVVGTIQFLVCSMGIKFSSIDNLDIYLNNFFVY